MDCIYKAYSRYLQNFGYRANVFDYLVYRILKILTHGISPQPTYGGIVPFILRNLAKLRGLSVRVQYRISTPAHLEESETNWVQKIIVNN